MPEQELTFDGLPYAAAVERVAMAVHAIKRAYCEAIGEDGPRDWQSAPEWQRQSARAAVDLHLTREAGPEASHADWMRRKVAEGWVYGPRKNAAKKTHPFMVPWEELPSAQRTKGHLIRATVHALRCTVRVD